MSDFKANKPFCDGTHNKVGFQSECQAHDPAASQAEGVMTSVGRHEWIY